jgi:hypothetical protein
MQVDVSGDGPSRESVRRMVVAHDAAMNGVDGWTLVAEPSPAAAILTVTPDDSAAMSRLKALGFIGVLTPGMHHQQHHGMLANGLSPYP